MSASHRPSPEFPHTSRCSTGSSPSNNPSPRTPSPASAPGPRPSGRGGGRDFCRHVGHRKRHLNPGGVRQSRRTDRPRLRQSRRAGGAAKARPALRTFRHRWIRGDQLAYLAEQVAATRREYGSLGDRFRGGLEAGGFAQGLDHLAQALRGPRDAAHTAPRGYRSLFPTPTEGSHSPCKRLTLYVRWMSRTGFPDLGVWSGVPSSELRIPLDLHVHWIASTLA